MLLANRDYYSCNGRLQIKTVWVLKELYHRNRCYPAFIAPEADVVRRHNDLLKRVANCTQRTSLLLDLVRIWHPPCGLDIIALAPFIRNEIHLQRKTYGFALLVFSADRDVPDINEEITIAKFVVYDVFHDVIFFVLSKGKDGIPKSQILEIVFGK